MSALQRIHLRVQTPIGKMKTRNEWRCKNKRCKINIPLSLCIHSRVNGTCVNVRGRHRRGGCHTCSEMNGVSVFLGKLLAPEHTLDGQMLAGTPKRKKQDGGREEKIIRPGQNERHNAGSTQEEWQKRVGHCTVLLPWVDVL